MSIRGLCLTKDEREMLLLERELARKSKNQDLDLKSSCLLAVADGIPQRDTAENFAVPLRTLEWWVQQYRSAGLQALMKGPYPGKASLLTLEQKQELAGIIGGRSGESWTGYGSLDCLRRIGSHQEALWCGILHVPGSEDLEST